MGFPGQDRRVSPRIYHGTMVWCNRCRFKRAREGRIDHCMSRRLSPCPYPHPGINRRISTLKDPRKICIYAFFFFFFFFPRQQRQDLFKNKRGGNYTPLTSARGHPIYPFFPSDTLQPRYQLPDNDGTKLKSENRIRVRNGIAPGFCNPDRIIHVRFSEQNSNACAMGNCCS